MALPADFVPGRQWVARGTPRNRLNEIPADSFVWLTFVTALDVSIYVDKGGRKLKLSREALAGNFVPVLATPPNRAYAASKPAIAVYR